MLKKIFFFFSLITVSFACHPCICTENASHSQTEAYLAAQRESLLPVAQKLKNTEAMLKILIKEKQIILQTYKALYAMETANTLKLMQISKNLEKENAFLYLKFKAYKDFTKENILINKINLLDINF